MDSPAPPQYTRVVAPIMEDSDAPADIQLDKTGRLYRAWLAYENFTGSMIDAMNVWYQEILPLQVAARPIVLPNGNRVRFTDVMCFPPTEYEGGGRKAPLYPHKARNYMLSYTAAVQAVPQLLDPSGAVLETAPPVPLGKIPVMLGSWLCHLAGKTRDERAALGEDPNDPLGYFVYKGSERTIIAQEKQRMDRILVQEEKRENRIKAFMTCSTPAGSTIVSVYPDAKTKALRVGLRLFGRSTKRNSLPLVGLLRFLLAGLGVDANEDAIMERILLFTRPEWRKKLWMHMQMSFWQAAQPEEEDFVAHIWKTWELPTNKDATGKFAVPTPLGMRPKRGEAPPPEGAPLTAAERRALLTEEVRRELFPPMEGERPEHRVHLLALMTARLLEAKAGLRGFDDRDDWANKRTEHAPRCCEQLFTGLWKKVIDLTQLDVDEAKGKVKTLGDVLNKFVGHTRYITDEYTSSFVTSNWGVKPYKGVSCLRENVSEILKRESYLATVAQLKKINTPVAREGKIPILRYVHNSQLGYVCPVETPEGVNCGLNKFYSATCVVSVQRNDAVVRALIDPHLRPTPGGAFVVLNGKFIGWGDGDGLRRLLLDARRAGQVWRDTCVIHEGGGLWVYTDGARLVRPLLRVSPTTGALLIDEMGLWKAPWEQLVRTACVEYLDAWEANSIYIAEFAQTLLDRQARVAALRAVVEQGPSAPGFADAQEVLYAYAKDKPYAYCEIDPSAILSVSASIIPLANHNQAPRNTYQASMGKQATGIFHSNHADRFDTLSRVLAFPSRPLFEPMINKSLGLNEYPAGQMAMVAILADPYNQEDAFVLNKGAVDRGLFSYTKYTSFRAVERTAGSIIDELKRPPATLITNPTAYAHLLEDGTPQLGAYVGPGDAIIGVVRRVVVAGVVTVRNESVTLAKDEKGIVDKVLVGVNDENKRFIRVKLRDVRKPQVGDKLASRSAQKGTISDIREERLMPRTADGTVPDILINPHSIPSRMTMGKMIEFIAGKVGALSGKFINASSFRTRDATEFQAFYDDLRGELAKYGFSSTGKEVMYSGVTGERLQGEVYFGPVYYQLLKHTVEDKIQARATGSYTRDTRQPTHGKGRGGGLRLGEMERDAIISHGATELLQERLMKVSDAFTTAYCYNCGALVGATVDLKNQECRNCGVVGKYGQYTAPYPYKLVVDLLQGVGFRLNYNMVLDDEGRRRAALPAVPRARVLAPVADAALVAEAAEEDADIDDEEDEETAEEEEERLRAEAEEGRMVTEEDLGEEEEVYDDEE